MEAEFVRWLAERIPKHTDVPIGIGDDAAVLCPETTVVTSDMLTEGVDFLLDQVSAERIGHKSLAVNLSDLAAMAAVPIAAIVSLALPRRGADTLARQLYEGILRLADRYDVAIAGGDTNTWDGGLVISITALGRLTERGPLRRTGAQPGDQILVTGTLGGSLLGKHLDFEPRVRESLQLRQAYELHAGMDISDGLALDLSRLAAASGCGAVLDLDSVPIATAAHERCQRDPSSGTPLEHALADGEDFELVITAATSVADRILAEQPLPDLPITRVGTMIAETGLWQTRGDSARVPLVARGFEHQADPPK